ncbi:uncharacterized protein EI90DRAFT_3084997 [Cantharellus anzutake]|uniref:uncharacterized protein n=1 Tax=Cantharellus anzutake TaxID=1750568 RepID=UPI0019067FD9|nr:uncharacterized protein EI90DRAFT_3084997 [Cantharellus anzutake]KAF8317788.1 hypothetical protein EI90DRAFT_3084997 [Cantharellus anzutake]
MNVINSGGDDQHYVTNTSRVKPISPPRLKRKKDGATRYEKEIAGSPKPPDDFTERRWVGPWLMGETIGKGASGRVRLAKNRHTGKIAAIKIVPKLRSDGSVDAKAEKVMQSIRREMVVLKLIHHPHIMHMYDVYENEDELYLLLEYVEGGELFDHLVSKGRLPLQEALCYFKQIISGVDYCHQFNICHRDLKPENLLLNANRNIKIADFGMAALELHGGTGFLQTSCGSPHYASPEIVAGKAYHGAASDIWSCGVVLYALLTGCLPFDHPDIGELLKRVRSGRFKMPRDIPHDAKDLLARMLVVAPGRRISMRRILAHPFFNLEFTVKVPLISPPPFSALARPLESESHIDLLILENLTTLFRGVSQREIVKSLVSPEKTWEKAFYHLLKDYAERQSEEYGNGMSFIDPTGKEDPIIMSTSLARNRSSLQSNGPNGTIKARYAASSVSASPDQARYTLRENSIPSESVNRSEGTKASLGSVAQHAARVDSASTSSSSRRWSRADIGGPRPRSISEVPDGYPAVSTPQPRVLPTVAETEATAEKPSPSPGTPKVFKVPEPRVVNPEYPARPAPQRILTEPTSSFSSNLPASELYETHHAYAHDNFPKESSPVSPPLRSVNPSGNRARIVQRLTEQRLRNATIMGTSGIHSNGAPLVGLGIALPDQNRTSVTQDVRLPAEVSSRLGTPPAGPRPFPPPKSPRHVPLTFSPDLNNTNSTAIASESPKVSPRRRATESQATREAPTVAVFKRSSLAVPKSSVAHQEHAHPGYPSPPPSQVSVQETFSVFQQSPVFTERFSLNLDAMMSSFRPPRSIGLNVDGFVGVGSCNDDSVSAKDGSVLLGDSKAENSKLADDLNIDKSSTWGVDRNSKPSIASSSLRSHDRDGSVSSPLTSLPSARREEAHSILHSGAGLPKAPVLATDQSNSVPSAGPQKGTDILSSSKETSSQKENSPFPSQNSEIHEGEPRGDRLEAKPRPCPLDLSKPNKKQNRTSVVMPSTPMTAPAAVFEPVGISWFAQLFNVKPAAYVFQSQDTCEKARMECARILRSFGALVDEADTSETNGMLRCHINYMRGPTGKTVISKAVTFRVQIAPKSINPSLSAIASPLLNTGNTLASPSFEGCTVSLIQERGAKSSLEVVAVRLRQDWRLDSLRHGEVPGTPRQAARFFRT